MPSRTIRLLFLFCLINFSNVLAQKPPNILLICVDDLRTELGCYGNKVVKSPNLDKLSSQGRLFDRHYVQVPTCGASRHALLTGMRPVTRGHISNHISASLSENKKEETTPESFVHHFRRNGYNTVGIGKISHSPDGYVYGYGEEKSNQLELPFSWDEPLCDTGGWGTGWNAFFAYSGHKNRTTLEKQVKPYESADVPDTGYPDGLNAELALKKLNQLKDKDDPFLLAVGFFKPHLPFTAPKKYWDMYNREDIPLSPNPYVVKNMERNSLHKSGEFNGYALGEEKAALGTPLSDDYARKLRHGYYACISYIDAQIGKLLDELDKTGLSENTIVVVWGDHGWHLGDHTVWGKHTVFERALNSTLIMRIPGQDKPGVSTKAITETVDIYPTLTELCGLPTIDGMHGKSLVPVLKNPKNGKDEVAYSYFKNSITVRNDRYRLTKYFWEDGTSHELYDHKQDPNETTNIAATNPGIVEKLKPILDMGDTGLFDELKQ